ncbi:glycerate kinase [Salinibacterium soli]|uniref:Glycerate kinase n=1 Tax=Antiquaquibacter soli TaxID=3064523 RepID=A0ABT9BKD9_9MICO|nr:glycerate kinase [Protaetiibacter sp. WY-16]MDO7881491.1 glycerate kinase [Protaetiibacter sp. WY-16]
MPNTVVIAPDSFKGSLSARLVADAIAEGWASVRPDDELVLMPQADGGEGTLDAVEAAVPGARRRSAGLVTGPDGRPVPGEWLELPDGTAVTELAQSSGLPLMASPAPLTATTRGLGEVIRAALDAGARSVVIGLGGSASTDGGAGALSALGLLLLDEQGEPVPDGGAGLLEVLRIDRDELVAPPAGGVVLLTDVTAPLLGPSGAAAVFGPQKGASPEQVAELDRALGHFSRFLGGDPLAPGSGAAGGAGYGFAAAWKARIEPGADYLMTLSGLPSAIGEADLVLTGEGRFDDQSLGGKLVGQLIGLAGAERVGVIAGQVTASGGVWSASLTELAGSAEASLADTAAWLREAGRRAAEELG